MEFVLASHGLLHFLFDRRWLGLVTASKVRTLGIFAQKNTQHAPMRTVIQRVSQASVSIEGVEKSRIGWGLLILLGIEHDDTEDDILWLCRKIAALRIFSDDDGLMNLSVQDIGGEMIVVSQFTLFASTKKGNRPSFIRSAKPDLAVPLYKKFVETLRNESSRPVLTGEFGADMKVSLLNDGPVTIIIDSKNRE